MSRKPEITIEEMLKAVHGIERIVSTATYEVYVADWTARHAVQRGIEIISEASRRLPSDLTAGHPDIPWHQIHSIGNILRHEYHGIVDEVIWEIAKWSLPPLKAALTQMLSELDQSP